MRAVCASGRGAFRPPLIVATPNIHGKFIMSDIARALGSIVASVTVITSNPTFERGGEFGVRGVRGEILTHEQRDRLNQAGVGRKVERLYLLQAVAVLKQAFGIARHAGNIRAHI